MQLNLKEFFLSIETFRAAPNLPNFILITGLNGSGKTHFLRALHQKKIEAIDDLGNPMRAIFYDYSDLEPKDESHTPNHLASEKEFFWNHIQNNARKNHELLRKEITQFLGHEISEEKVYAIFKNPELQLSDLVIENKSHQEYLDYIQKAIKDKSLKIIEEVNKAFPELKENTKVDSSPAGIRKSLQEKELDPRAVVRYIEERSGIPLVFLERFDFDKFFPLAVHADPFQNSFSEWFVRYLAEHKKNFLRRYDYENLKGSNSHYLQDEEFFEIYGKFPWDFVNELLHEAGLDFTITNPITEEEKAFRAEIRNSAGKMIPFKDLSSGEKIIMSLAVALSRTDERGALQSFPDLILLDEIDATLHPSMTNFLLKVIDQVLVRKKNISVIMTTHSPSTIAMAQEETLFELRKKGSKKYLEKISKDKAISILTTGVPTLSVSYKNRKQVFVESKLDAEFFQKIYQETQEFLLQNSPERLEPHSDITLSFIPCAGSHTGNCETVKGQVNVFRQNGVDTIYGIIDWDKKNSLSDNVFVLGENKGYSIESFILDPLLVFILSMINYGKLDLEEFGLSKTFRFPEIEKLSSAELQNITENMLKKLALHSAETGNTIRKYLGGTEITLPNSFCFYPGHDLEKRYQSILPFLNSIGQKEGQLKREIINKAMHHFPRLIPEEFQATFAKIKQKT